MLFIPFSLPMLEKILITGRVNHRKVFVVGKHDDSNKSGIIIR